MKIVCERCSRATKSIGSPRADKDFGGISIRRTHKCKTCGHSFETHEGPRNAALTLSLKLSNKHFGAVLREFQILRDEFAMLRNELRALTNLSKK